MRAETPWTGVFTTLWMFATLLFGGAVLGLMPTAIVGGMLLYIGIDLISTWLIEVRKKLPWTDYAVVCLIALTIVLFGFVEGVAVGMLATLVLFAARLTRANVIAAHFTGREVRSTMLRSIPERAIYDAHGVRLGQFGPGTVFGGHGAHQGAARALADEQCATLFLSGAAKRVLEAAEPQLAIRLYRAATERTWT